MPTKPCQAARLSLLLSGVLMIGNAQAENRLDPAFASIGPVSDDAIAIQNLRWSMLDRDINSLTFRCMDLLFHTRVVGRAGKVAPLSTAAAAMDFSYQFNGQTYLAEQFLTRTYTNGLLVMKNGEVVIERYLNNMTPETRHIGWSMTKSITAILVGMAYEEGRIKSLDEPITHYIPELKAGGYKNVTIRQILQMTSGVDYEERYDFANPGPAARNHILALVKNVARFADVAKTIAQKHEPGSVFEYKTIDTAVLGWLLERVLDGSNVSAYAAQKLWEPLGAEQDAYFILDGKPGEGREFTGAGFNATLRDWARFGQMVLNGGEFNGHRFISTEYLNLATHPVLPEDPVMGGYGYQWWTVQDSNAYSAIGLQGQFIYIDPDTKTVVVKLSFLPPDAIEQGEFETFAFMAAVSNWQPSH